MEQPLDGSVADAVQALRELESRVPASAGSVALELGERVAWLLLDNPRAHNALTVTMMRQIAEAVDKLASWPGAIVAIASRNGGSFCSGGHLGQVRGALVDPAAARVMATSMPVVLDALAELPCVSVAVLEGAAVGGGVELASAADLRVATPDTVVYAAQVRLGVAAGWGGAHRIARHIGRGAALRMMVRSERLSAAQALDLGFVDHVQQGDRQELLEGLLGPALTHPVASVRAAKRQIARPADTVEAFLSVWGGPAHRRALGMPDLAELADRGA